MLAEDSAKRTGICAACVSRQPGVSRRPTSLIGRAFKLRTNGTCYRTGLA